MNEMITGKGTYNGELGIPATDNYMEHSKHDWTNQFYGKYTKDKLHVESEYRRYLRNQIVFNGMTWIETDVRGWYVSGGYQVTKWFEAGSYYSHYRIFSVGGPGLTDTVAAIPDVRNRDFDKVVTAKFIFNQYTTLKVEEHFMSGNGDSEYPNGFYDKVNPNGVADNTNALIIRAGFSF